MSIYTLLAKVLYSTDAPTQDQRIEMKERLYAHACGKRDIEIEFALNKVAF